ncbi:MAG: hypothetical protein M8872_10830 [marine benthic group bacterium]|nr:hypothetical protein [Gemmatimonadota bacterium]
MRARISLVLACAALVAVACQDTPTEPVEQPVATAPQFNFMNGPEMAGVVTRGEWEFTLLFDYTRDETEKSGEPWMIFMGLGIGDYHETCGGSNSSTPYMAQSIRDGIKLIRSPDMGVTVYPFEEFFGNYMSAPSGFNPVWYASCETTRIGSGTAHGGGQVTPAGTQYVIHGTIDYMGEAYKLKWVYKSFGKDGEMRTMRVK